MSHPAWDAMDEFAKWRHEKICATAKKKWEEGGCPPDQDLRFWNEAEGEFPLPQAIAEVIASGYGANDPWFQQAIKHYKVVYS